MRLADLDSLILPDSKYIYCTYIGFGQKITRLHDIKDSLVNQRAKN